MSSGPSSSCSYSPAPSGASSSKNFSMSRRTAGAAFSWMSKEADVWRQKSVSRPEAISCLASHCRTPEVISIKPRRLALTCRTCITWRMGTSSRCQLAGKDSRPRAMRAAISIGFIAMGCDRTRSPKASQEISQGSSHDQPFPVDGLVTRGAFASAAGSNHLLRPVRTQGRHAAFTNACAWRRDRALLHSSRWSGHQEGEPRRCNWQHTAPLSTHLRRPAAR